MTESSTQLEVALDRVVAAARAHLAAVQAAGGRVEDERVWQAYVELNNASYEYDDLLLEAHGEVTPWDVAKIDPERARQRALGSDGAAGHDPYPHVVSVRQRRDYRIPSVSALIRIAEEARQEAADDAEDDGPVETVSEALLELLQAGDGSLASLDVPELEPMDGLVAVAEVAQPLDVDAFEETDGAGPFQLGEQDRLVGRLDEHPYRGADDEDPS